MKVKIIGGKSQEGSIAIFSARFLSVAVAHNGEIACSVKPRSQNQKFWLKWKRWPIPRIIIFLFSFMSGWKAALVLAMIAGVAVATWQNNQDTALFAQWQIVAALALLVSMIYRTEKARTWHAAEHMAIKAYNHNETTELSEIAKQSPIDPLCGNRLLPPLFASILLTRLVATTFGLSDVLAVICCIEVIFWVEFLIGWHRIPLSSHLSLLIQRYITTKQPGEIELKTAQTALRQLVVAHSPQTQ